MITLFAPAGIGEVGTDTDLAAVIAAAVAADPLGPLRTGDIVVVTSKVLSKAEGRSRPAAEREQAIDAEAVRTVARRGPTRIVLTRHGLTLAAAGVDNSNVDSDTILLLPVDPDASAARLRHNLETRTGTTLGVVVSDTAGRAWRIGQTDQAIGASGVRVVQRYAGQYDAYGNELQVTAVAIADELASAADLVKSKLSGRPVAVVRGLSQHLAPDVDASDVDPVEDAFGPSETQARVLVREQAQDLFRYGSREAVIAAVLTATDQAETYEEVLDEPSDEALIAAVVRGSGRSGAEADLLQDILRAGLQG